MRAIAKWEEVPIFDSEEAEADFWAENKPDLRLMEAAVAGNSETSESVAISLRIDPRLLSRIKRLAQSRFLNYQSMIKQWLSERMEDELRERSKPHIQSRKQKAESRMRNAERGIQFHTTRNTQYATRPPPSRSSNSWSSSR